MPRASMTHRLMLWLTAVTILFWLGAAGFGAYVMHHEFDEVFDSALQETAQRLAPLVVYDLSRRGLEPRRVDDAGTPEHHEYLTYQVRDREGRVLVHSHDAQAAPFEAPLRPGFHDTPTQRIYTEAAADDALFLQVADPLAHRHEATMEGALTLVLPLLVLAPLSVLVIWLIVSRTLSPVGSLRREIGKRDSGNLSPLALGDMPTELESIATSVDHLLERLRAALEVERHFTANSAHELRTPIAGALAQTQRLIAELPEGAGRDRARQVEASLDELAALAEKLMQLARAEAGIGAVNDPVDLVPVARLVVEHFERSRLHAGRIVLRMPEETRLVRKVDVDAFAIILRNLIENALVHGDLSEPVHVGVDPVGVVSVVNAGPTVPKDQLHGLTQRFRRGKTRARGSGLGLAIAQMLVLQIGGRLELHSPAAGRPDGFEARIVLGPDGRM